MPTFLRKLEIAWPGFPYLIGGRGACGFVLCCGGEDDVLVEQPSRMTSIRSVLLDWFDPADCFADHLIARWLFLRALGLIYFSAFFALLYQVRGLIGSEGILPAGEFLRSLHQIGWLRFWYAPTLLWFSSSDTWLMTVCWAGLIAALLVVADIWPRAMLLVCFLSFLSFVAAAEDFSGYQSDGMLLEAVSGSGGSPAGVGRAPAGIAGGDVSAAVGVVPDLLRVGGGEAGKRRPDVAQPDCNV
jgi:hypothetical protein